MSMVATVLPLTEIQKRSKNMMIMLIAMNIVNENFDFSFKDVPKIFKKKVKAQLVLMGHPELANDDVVNYSPAQK